MELIIDTKKINLVLVAILIIATILRFYNIGFQDVWLDEISTMNVSNPALSFHETNLQIMSKEGFPHLYWYSLKILSFLFGHNIVVLRVFSAFFGTLSVYVIYLFAKELLNKNAGYIAATLLTVNPFHIYHSQDARVYSLLMFFVILASYRLIVFINNNNNKNAILFGIAAGLIPNAHPLGVLNVGVLFITLLFVIILEKQKPLKTIIFKQSFLAGVITFIIALGCYPIFSKVSKATSFWIPPASLDNLKNAFFEMLGGNQEFFYFYLVGLVLFFILIVIKIVGKKKFDKSSLIFFILMLSWVSINIGVIIVKSYVGVSIILSRYFIGSLPLFLMAATYIISTISIKPFKYSLLSVFVVFSLHYIIFTTDYYNRISKTEFDKLINEVIQKNRNNNDEIISVWGWLLNSHIDKTKTNYFVSSTLENYISDLKNNAVTKKSFWYLDGNSQPFNLGEQDRKFLEDNFILDDDVTKYYDCWAKHYSPKTRFKSSSNETNISLNSFLPYSGDGKGGLNMFENGKVKLNYKMLPKGSYKFELTGTSFPSKPIDGKNALMRFYVNDVLLSSFELSEKVNSKYYFDYNQLNSKEVNISLEFLNDYSKDGMDRNVQISSLKIKKIL